MSRATQIDEMGDKVGRVYVDSQDLSTLQARKFKGLKGEKKRYADNDEGEAAPASTEAGSFENPGRKKSKTE